MIGNTFVLFLHTVERRQERLLAKNGFFPSVEDAKRSRCGFNGGVLVPNESDLRDAGCDFPATSTNNQQPYLGARVYGYERRAIADSHGARNRSNG